jgi:uncharacterized membrane protein YdjX (TVP38/TMEM64 family)
VNHRRRLIALAAGLALVFATLTALVVAGVLSPSSARAWVEDNLRDPVAGLGAAGPVLFVLASACLTVALFPGPVLAATSGLLFGTAVGFPATLCAATLGATLAFSLSRWWARDAVEELAGRRIRALRDWIGRRGFVSVLYARIAPGMPYNLVNYAAGLTSVRLASFAGATALGAAPRAFAYTALGGTLGDLRSPEAVVAVVVLVIMALGGAVALRRDLRGPAPAVTAPGSASATSTPDGRSAGPP